MLRMILLAAVCALPLGCGDVSQGVPDTARLQPGQLGTNGDPDVTALNFAQWAFADSGRTYGRPADAARAAASLDYMAGALYASPRWLNLSAETKEQLLQGRQEVRDALGVVPGTPSQILVDRLTGAADALTSGDQATAVRQLGPPAFDAPGEQVLTRLSNMPYLRMANVSTMRAANELYESSTGIDWSRQ